MRLTYVLLAATAACGGRPEKPATTSLPSAAVRARESRVDPLSAAAMMRDARWLASPERRGRGFYSADEAAAADYIARELSDAGLEVARQAVAGGSENIIGIVRGDSRAVIVSAHHDHLGVGASGEIYLGADDNASGVAVALAMARAAADSEFRHTVLFIFFGAEEDGLVGSGFYVHDPYWPLADTAALINFDMVGRNFFEAGAAKERTAAVVGLEDHEGAQKAAEDAARAVGLELVRAPARLLELFGFQDRTDDWWFRRQGILSIHFSTGLHDDYHQPTDTVDRLVPSQMERVGRTAYAVLAHLAGEISSEER